MSPIVRLLVGALFLSTNCTSAQASGPRPVEVLRIWPGEAPGTASWSGPEEQADAELPKLGKVHIITNVRAPTLTIFRPTTAKASGTAMLVVPGGAFRALAWDLDGIETAQWLAGRGITAFVLKYRVRPPGASAPSGPESFDAFAARTRPAHDVAIADAARALALIRSRAESYAIAPGKVGMIGFSAGAMTVMSLAMAENAADRPDFAVSLYGALLVPGAPPAGAPPLFIVAAQDDPQVPPARSVEIFERWTSAGLAAELHLYEKGGHGFGFRPHKLPADGWTAALEAWLAARGYITSEQNELSLPATSRNGGQ